MTRLRGVIAATALGTLALTACTAGGSVLDIGDLANPEAIESVTATPTASPPEASPPPPSPKRFACYRLGYDDAIAPTTSTKPVKCEKRHTSRTFAVGALDNVVDGHLLAVDSERVQDWVARRCPRRFAEYVGGSETDRRLSMLRPVWFAPTVDESDAGAEWYRCDVIVLARDSELRPLDGRLAGVLDIQKGRDRFAMCGTSAPGTKSFEHVACSEKHAWRAVDVVEFPGEKYPGRDAARQRGRAPCEEAGADAAADALDYRWGYEWPTKEQWKNGQTYGRCWIPD